MEQHEFHDSVSAEAAAIGTGEDGSLGSETWSSRPRPDSDALDTQTSPKYGTTVSFGCQLPDGGPVDDLQLSPAPATAVSLNSGLDRRDSSPVTGISDVQPMLQGRTSEVNLSNSIQGLAVAIPSSGCDSSLTIKSKVLATFFLAPRASHGRYS